MKRFKALSMLLVCALSACGGGGTGSADSAGTVTESGGSVSVAAAQLTTRLGVPQRFLVGLGTGNDPANIQSQGLRPDIYDRYLTGVGAGSWPDYNNPSGAYVNLVAADADAMGAVPMFTLYQMASNGDGNLAGLADPTFMIAYWNNVRLLFQRLALYGKPALVNLEPDFWGYAEKQSGGDPGVLYVDVGAASECAGLPNNVSGIVGCVLRLAQQYAPQALIGIPISDWGGSTAEVVAFMQAVGAGHADFTVVQTLDRDAGCFEAATEADCLRAGSGWYWDETNSTHPDFADHLQMAQAYHQGIGLPLLWWQTPLGVPSATPGGSAGHWRDNREHYFLTHPAELVAAGGFGVVFGAGTLQQTTISTDGGQFQRLSSAYLANPVVLP